MLVEMQAPAHAEIGGSAKHLWSCEMARTMCKGAPKREAGIAAEQGTELHTVLELYLTGKKTDAADMLIGSELISDLQRSLMPGALAQFDTLLSSFGSHSKIGAELRCEIGEGLGFRKGSELAMLSWGTSDLVAFDPERGHLLVGDFKSGRVHVSSDSDQLLLYAAGAALEYGDQVKTVELAIIQFGREIDSRTLTIEQARSEWDRLGLRLWKMVKDPKEFEPGAHCQWCPALGKCRAAGDYVLGDIEEVINQTHRQAPQLKTAQVAPTLSSEELSKIVAREKQTKDFLAAARVEITRRAIAGEPVEKELKWVRSVTRRTWTNQSTVLAVALELGVLDKIAPPKLISPTQALELLPEAEAHFQKLIIKPTGAPALVARSDRRKEFLPSFSEIAELNPDVINFDDE
jgi:hypothetical protein